MRSLLLAALVLLPVSAAANPILIVPNEVEGACYTAGPTRVDVVDGLANTGRTVTVGEDATITVLVPLRAGTADDHGVWFDREQVTLEAISAEEGHALIAELAKRRSTPELLAAAGFPLLVGEFEIAAGSVRGMSATSVLPMAVSDGMVTTSLGVRTYGTTCNTPVASARAVLSAATPIGAVFAPYHDPRVTRIDERTVDVVIDQCGKQHDVHLVLATSDERVAASALTYRKSACTALDQPEGPGYLLLAAGATQTESTDAVAKDVVLVVDTSGSMQGEKMSQVKSAVRSIIGSLGPDDRYDLVHFASEATAVFGELVPRGDERQLNAALGVNESLQANGSTNINDALLLAANALNSAGGDNTKMILFLTDGAATAGETDALTIVANVLARDEVGTRVFSFGVGDNVNTRLLDEVARQTGGETTYIRPGSDIEAALTGFYEKVRAPVATDLELTSSGVTVTDRYPDTLPDLFVGGSAFALGRYADAPAASLGLHANTQDGPTAFAVAGVVARDDTRFGFLPRLWASRRLGALLYQAREDNSAPETVAAIQALALEHGFVTRFTPFVVGEDGKVELEYEAPTGADVGSAAVDRSGYTNDLSGNSNAGAYSHTDAPIVSVHDRTFFREEGIWIDTRVRGLRDEGAMGAPIIVHFGSAQWAWLAASSVEARRVLSVGRQVLFELGCQVVQVVDPAIDSEDRFPAEDAIPDGIIRGADPEVARPLPAPAPPPAAAKGDALPEAEAVGCSTGLGGGHSAALYLSALICVLAVRRRRRR